MRKSSAVLGKPLLTALLGTVFCVWSALGNDVSFCVTAGCTLYEDFNIAGISLWWLGTAAFVTIAACALFGQIGAGCFIAALFLAGDVALLLLMSLTAPCISCLVVACLFALSFLFFRNYAASLGGRTIAVFSPGSLLLWVWLALFVINLGQAARSQINIWPILDESGEARGRMFFSPSCRFCVEGINVLSGNVNMAFYPVAENDEDVFRLLKIRELLEQGENLADAITKSIDAPVPGFFSSLSPDILYFRFRLLCNKAHVYAAGSRGIPFFEYLGLPPDVRKMVENNGNSVLKEKNPAHVNHGAGNPDLPVELLDGQCRGGEPCSPTP